MDGNSDDEAHDVDTKTQNQSESEDEMFIASTKKKSRRIICNSDNSSDEEIVSNPKPNIKPGSPNAENEGESTEIECKSYLAPKTDENEGLPRRMKSQDSDSDEDLNIFKSNNTEHKSSYHTSDGDKTHVRSKIPSPIDTVSDEGINTQKTSSNEDSEDSESNRSDEGNSPNLKSRSQNKKQSLNKKFHDLLSSRKDKTKKINRVEDNSDSHSSGSDDEVSSIDKIKKKIKERTQHLKSTIYDPDTSDDEQAHKAAAGIFKSKKKQKDHDSPKPVRMSAKQAMENMVKIKSESNRMLREKDISLPYHRPKALKLKDIMSRRKPALTADGKSLPLKMNEEQLQKYAEMLEVRQKEMMELCKSESDDDVEESNNTSAKCDETANNGVNQEEADTKTIDDVDMSIGNDVLFDKTVENADTLNVSGVKPTEHDTGHMNDDNMENSTENSESNQDANIPNSEEVQCEVLKNQTTEETNENDIKQDTEPDTVQNSSQNNSTGDATEQVSINSVDSQLQNTEADSQNISLHLDSENMCNNMNVSETESKKIDTSNDSAVSNEDNDKPNKDSSAGEIEGFSDTEMDVEDIDKIIENAELIEGDINKEVVDSPMLIRDPIPRITKPKLTGGPGMVIDLDPILPSKLSGIELLKERFTYFNKLKTPDEIERQTKAKIKPGTQHLKLKQELEEKIAEQRSMEWAKRLDEEKQHEMEMKAMNGEESDEEDLETLEAKLEEIEDTEDVDNHSESGEEEPIEDDVLIEDKPKKKNALVDDEAEESECDETNEVQEESEDVDQNNENADASDEDESEEESESEDELDTTSAPKKGRILKAFEDSDEEDLKDHEQSATNHVYINENIDGDEKKDGPSRVSDALCSEKSCSTQGTQDDEIQSAQFQKSVSEDMFSQESDIKSLEASKDSVRVTPNTTRPHFENLNKGKEGVKLDVICETQPFDEDKFDEIAGMCSGTFSQNVITQPLSCSVDTETKSQEIGEHVLELCTGKFFDNQFVSQTSDQMPTEPIDSLEIAEEAKEKNVDNRKEEKKLSNEDGTLLKSILDELDDPEFESQKPNKFFTGGANDKDNKQSMANNFMKKRFVIDSDDEESGSKENVKPKKLKKKKLKDRALQISDDEEEDVADEEWDSEEEYASAIEDDTERVVEYDSEENEVELVVQSSKTSKKRRKGNEFFEQEAELTSEDEWAGSGDEDEAGLDRMEREEGDDDKFHQGRLQRELEQIHMRDVLDQDKREVRMIQELLFEDGDLGDGHRQRKFRWKDLYGPEEGEEGTAGLELSEQTQEEESEETWRRQRHEREAYLNTLKKKQGEEEDDMANVSFNRTALIKANLSSTSKANSSLLLQVKCTKEEMEHAQPEKKTTKDIPSPVKKPFSLMQAYGGSLLSRAGALTRLAALAPAGAGGGAGAGGAEGGEGTGRATHGAARNFVFAAVSPDTATAKVSKRKAEANIGTPNLMKKLKTEEKKRFNSKLSLLDQMKA